MNRFCVLATLTATFCLPFACSDEQRDAATDQRVDESARVEARDLGDAAARAAAKQQYTEAAVKFARAHRLDPENEGFALAASWRVPTPDEVSRALAAARSSQEYAARNAIDQALVAIREATALDPFNINLGVIEGKLLAGRRLFDEAALVAEKLQKVFPSRIEGWRLGLEVAHASGHREGVLATVEQMRACTTNEQTDDPRLLFIEAAACTTTDTVGRSIEILRQLVASFPENLEYKDALSARYFSNGTFDASADLTRELLEKGQDSYLLHARLAAAFERLGRDDEAIAAYRLAVKHPQGPGHSRVGLARLLVRHGGETGIEEACRLVSDHLEAHPNDVKALAVALSIAKKKDDRHGCKEFTRRLERTRYAEREIEDRMRDLNDHVVANPTDIEKMLVLAKYQFDRGDAATALPHLRGVLDIEPDNIEALEMSAKFLLDVGRNEDAYWDARRIVDRHPRDMRGLQLAAVGACRTNRWQEALDFAEAGLVQDPENRLLAEIRARAMAQGHRSRGGHARDTSPVSSP